MRAWIGALGLVALVGCGEPPPCGVDQDGEDVPYCEVTFPDLAEPLAFCPLEHWAASDASKTRGSNSMRKKRLNDDGCGTRSVPSAPRGARRTTPSAT